MPLDEYVIEYEPWVLDEIRALPRHLQRLVVKRMAEFVDEPRPKGFEKLESGACRIFYEHCRITYVVDDANRTVTVTRVAQDIPLP